jgi:hypothetical protein
MEEEEEATQITTVTCSCNLPTTAGNNEGSEWGDHLQALYNVKLSDKLQCCFPTTLQFNE